MSQANPVIEMPASTKLLPCAKCGQEQLVAVRVVMIFCPACSTNMGVKK
jgi:hypothetical protein